MDHPNAKTGRWSKHMPTRLLARFKEGLDDPDLIAVRPEIALLDTRIADILEQVNNSESGELWKRLKEALREYDHAKNDGDRAEAFGRMRWLINEGHQEYMNWMDIRHTIEDRRRLVETERQRLKDLHQMIDAKQALLLIGAIGNIIRENVSDTDTLRRITRSIEKLYDSQPRGNTQS